MQFWTRNLFSGLILLLLADAASAANIQQVTATPSSAGVGAQVQISVQKGGSGNCGALLLFGDGATFGPFGFGSNPRVFTHSYAQAGTYTITAQPKKKGNLAKCNGAARTTTVTITGGGGGGGKRPVAVPGGRPTIGKKRAPMKRQQRDPDDGKIIKVIKAVDVKPYANSVDFWIQLGADARVTVTATPQEAAPNPSPVSVSKKLTAGKHTKFRLDGVSPGTAYKYKVVVNNQGGTFTKEGPFRTKKRSVRIVVREVHAIDDGDDTDAGEFGFTLHGYENPNGLYQPRVDFNHDISTGTMVNSNESVTFENVRERSLKVGVSVSESDSGFGNRGDASTRHFEKNLNLGWANDRKPGTQTRALSWDVKKGGDNAFHVVMKVELRVSYGP